MRTTVGISHCDVVGTKQSSHVSQWKIVTITVDFTDKYCQLSHILQNIRYPVYQNRVATTTCSRRRSLSSSHGNVTLCLMHGATFYNTWRCRRRRRRASQVVAVGTRPVLTRYREGGRGTWCKACDAWRWQNTIHYCLPIPQIQWVKTRAGKSFGNRAYSIFLSPPRT